VATTALDTGRLGGQAVTAAQRLKVISESDEMTSAAVMS